MKNTIILFVFFFALQAVSIGQGVLINEFMSKNNSIIQDEDGDYSDWVELYNSSSTDINMLNYSLSDDNSDLNKWIFPNIIIPAKTYLIVFASSKNRNNPNELHTNFKISSGGEELYLSNNSNVIIDQSISISLNADESYGRVPDGGAIWIKMDTPSPAASNNSANQLQFSHKEGFYTKAFTLTINSVLSDTIYYTLNGDVPTESSSVFVGSMLIINRDSFPNVFSDIVCTPSQNIIGYPAWESPLNKVDKATILRCASFKNGIRTSEIYTKTFFVDENMSQKYTLPIVSLVTQRENLFNQDTGIYVPGIHYNVNDPEWSGNYFMHGDQWERDVHIEYFDKNGKLGFSQDAGIRIHGGGSRVATQKSFRLYAREEYGAKYFNYKIFPENSLNNYKRFVLRASMGDWNSATIIKDIVAQDISHDLNVDCQDFQAVIVYLNGEYWGIQTIRDRIDERYISYKYSIDKDSVEFRGWLNPNYENLMSFIEHNDLENNSNYDYVKTQMDISNYIDYTIAEFFFKNYDWPANNMKIWRKKSNGKWRWILYDIDAGFVNADYNMFQHATRNDINISWPNSPESTFLFRSLLKNESFRNRFINRYAEILKKVFVIEEMKLKCQRIESVYKPEISKHSARWNSPTSTSRWENNIDNDIISFLEKRPCIVEDHIIGFFKLDHFDFDCRTQKLNSNLSEIVIAPNPTNGSFYIYNNSDDIYGASIVITDINGAIVYKKQEVEIKKYNRENLELLFLANGTYIVHIYNDNISKRVKMVIMN